MARHHVLVGSAEINRYSSVRAVLKLQGSFAAKNT